MLKKLIIILLFFSLVGCSKDQSKEKEFELTFFYVDTCHNCENFKMIAIPKLKNEFSNIHVNYYNLDEYHDLYDQYILSAIDFDEEEYESVPCVIIDDQLMIVGYSIGEEDELIKEIHHLFNKEPLGQFYIIGEYKLEQAKIK